MARHDVIYHYAGMKAWQPWLAKEPPAGMADWRVSGRLPAGRLLQA